MKVRIYENHWLPRFLNWLGMQIAAITIFPFIMLSGTMADAPVVIQHEFVHVRQIKEQGWVKFYATYLWDFGTIYCSEWDREEAYMKIPAEVEAYDQQETAPYPEPSEYILIP